ncbi:MAG: hypothetical protein UY64_C0024G0003 [Parcubacteria group bacterium GW2011_GWA1_51_12]|nr:MAG: hypothetical protein UY64_C0024G0003 [Parcubacteria group bacterium GW2011_GWA1_51_12]
MNPEGGEGRYSLKEAREEAEILRSKVEVGEAENYEEANTQIEEEKNKNAAVEEVRKEYLLGVVSAKIEYLRNLYQEESGVDLHHIAGIAEAEHGTAIGSVSVGMGLKQSLRIEQRLQVGVHPLPDHISIEMGTDLKEIQKREKLVDWVGPHEVGHLVDWSLENITGRFLQKRAADIDSLMNTIEPRHRDRAREAIDATLKECAIDGIGFYLASKYGTTDPFLTKFADRVGSIVRGFTRTQDVFRQIIKTEAKDPESKSFYSVVALRMAAVGEALEEIARETKVDKKTADALQARLRSLDEIFSRINSETGLLGDEATETLKRLCKDFFSGTTIPNAITKSQEDKKRVEREKQQKAQKEKADREERDRVGLEKERQRREQQRQENDRIIAERREKWWEEHLAIKEYMDEAITRYAQLRPEVRDEISGVRRYNYIPLAPFDWAHFNPWGEGASGPGVFARDLITKIYQRADRSEFQIDKETWRYPLIVEMLQTGRVPGSDVELNEIEMKRTYSLDLTHPKS